MSLIIMNRARIAMKRYAKSIIGRSRIVNEREAVIAGGWKEFRRYMSIVTMNTEIAIVSEMFRGYV
jgi:hypothetical protein